MEVVGGSGENEGKGVKLKVELGEGRQVKEWRD